MFDVKKLGGGASNSGNSKVSDPRKLFGTLSRDPRFRRPSDEQGEVLDKWYAQRTLTDNTIKMNTGAGKTLVGLLALQSSLNEDVGPAVYITPDNFLANQVLREASELGIQTTEDPKSAAYVSGKAILVANVHKLVNGKSVFGVGSEGVKIPIGTVVIDDAHACLSIIAEKFTLKLSADHDAYKKLLALFENHLSTQSEAGLLDVKAGDPQAMMLVPYWAWKDSQASVTKILHDHRDDEDLRFVWPLLKDVLPLCQCAFSGQELEISPRLIPIDEIRSFMRAKRRIYMTATLADDGQLISHFQVSADSVANPIKPKGVGEIGDRMILAPQEINPQITDDEIKDFVVDVAKKHNVAVIVPSHKRAEYWSDVADQTLSAANIEDGVSLLKKGQHIGITVLVGKYDGVDLPGDACRLLVIDGLPEVSGILERIEMAALEGTDAQLMRQIQRIEQGMGRGVRSGEDHCAVILMGYRLTQRVVLPSARSKFTPATLTQLDLSREVAEMIAGQPISAFRDVFDHCIEKESDWWRTGRERLANASEGQGSSIDPNIKHLREAFDHARAQQFGPAASCIQDAVNQTSDTHSKAYLKQQLAEYEHHTNPAKAQETQLSAYQANRRLLKPLKGISYSKLSAPSTEQAQAAIKFMKGRFLEKNDLIIFANALADDLSWYPDDHNRFEGAVRELGSLLGFGSQRPEQEIGKGPDNLWAVRDLRFLVIEAKNGATSNLISKADCNQLLGSLEWFKHSYDGSCKATPVLIHPENTFDKYSSPHAEFRILDRKGLKKLSAAVRDYVTAIADNFDDKEVVRKALKTFGLTAEDFVNTYTTGFKRKS